MLCVAHYDDGCCAVDVVERNVVEVRDDTVNIQRVIPYRYIAQEKWICGVDFSYNHFDSDDANIALLIENLSFDGSLLGVHPYVGYFYKNNNCIGLKLGYSAIIANLNSVDINLGDDAGIALDNISIKNQTYSVSLFHRIYCGLSQAGVVAFYNDTDLMLRYGIQHFISPNEENNMVDSKTVSREVALNLSPGISFFVVENINAYVSMSIASLSYKEQKQYIDSLETGYRYSGGLKFKFDILSLKIGISLLI